MDKSRSTSVTLKSELPWTTRSPSHCIREKALARLRSYQLSTETVQSSLSALETTLRKMELKELLEMNGLNSDLRSTFQESRLSSSPKSSHILFLPIKHLRWEPSEPPKITKALREVPEKNGLLETLASTFLLLMNKLSNLLMVKSLMKWQHCSYKLLKHLQTFMVLKERLVNNG